MISQRLQERPDGYTAQVSIKDLVNGLRQLMRRASNTAYGIFLDRINWSEDAVFLLNPGLLARLPDELSVLKDPTRFFLEGLEVPVILENAVPCSSEKTFVYLLIKKIAGLEILGPPELAAVDQNNLDFLFRIENLAPWLQGRLEINF